MMLLLPGLSQNGIALEKDQTENQILLHQIQERIKENDAMWNASYNTMFTKDHSYSVLGCILEEETEEYDDFHQPLDSTDMFFPDEFDWRNVNQTNWVTPIKNQASCGSCTAFGTIASLESMLKISYNMKYDADLSEAHLFFCSGRNCNSGMALSEAATFVKHIGVTDEECFPYEPKDMDCSLKDDNWEDRVVTADYGTARRPAGIKEALVDYGPVLASFTVYEDFNAYTGGIYEHVTGSQVGGHAVTIIGYNDDPGYWICKNSWGKGWGEDGFFKIKYRECGIDETVYYFTDITGNIPPEKPIPLSPLNGETVSTTLNLSWQESIDQDGSQVHYTVYLTEGYYLDEDDVFIEDIVEPSVEITDLETNTIYTWKVIAVDEKGSEAGSEEITFSTLPPIAPIVQGSSAPRVRREYTYTASIDNAIGDEYYWFFKWGDETDSGWLGPYDADEEVSASHTWKNKGEYTIKVRYKVDGELSQWTVLPISTPQTKASFAYRVLDFIHSFLSLDQPIIGILKK